MQHDAQCPGALRVHRGDSRSRAPGARRRRTRLRRSCGRRRLRGSAAASVSVTRPRRPGSVCAISAVISSRSPSVGRGISARNTVSATARLPRSIARSNTALGCAVTCPPDRLGPDSWRDSTANPSARGGHGARRSGRGAPAAPSRRAAPPRATTRSESHGRFAHGGDAGGAISPARRARAARALPPGQPSPDPPRGDPTPPSSHSFEPSPSGRRIRRLGQ